MTIVLIFIMALIGEADHIDADTAKKILIRWRQKIVTNANRRKIRKVHNRVVLIKKRLSLFSKYRKIKRVDPLFSFLMNTLLRDLKAWRQEQAWREGIEPFRVLSNSAIEEIAELMPRTREELSAVRGIKERKFERYGAQILEIIREHILLNKKDDRQNSLVDELAHISVSFPRPPKADPPPAEKRESRVSADWIPDPSFAKATAGRQVGNDTIKI